MIHWLIHLPSCHGHNVGLCPCNALPFYLISISTKQPRALTIVDWLLQQTLSNTVLFCFLLFCDQSLELREMIRWPKDFATLHGHWKACPFTIIPHRVLTDDETKIWEIDTISHWLWLGACLHLVQISPVKNVCCNIAFDSRHQEWKEKQGWMHPNIEPHWIGDNFAGSLATTLSNAIYSCAPSAATCGLRLHEGCHFATIGHQQKCGLNRWWHLFWDELGEKPWNVLPIHKMLPSYHWNQKCFLFRVSFRSRHGVRLHTACDATHNSQTPRQNNNEAHHVGMTRTPAPSVSFERP